MAWKWDPLNPWGWSCIKRQYFFLMKVYVSFDKRDIIKIDTYIVIKLGIQLKVCHPTIILSIKPFNQVNQAVLFSSSRLVSSQNARDLGLWTISTSSWIKIPWIEIMNTIMITKIKVTHTMGLHTMIMNITKTIMIMNATKVTNITKLIMLKNEKKNTTNTTSFRLKLIEQWEEE